MNRPSTPSPCGVRLGVLVLLKDRTDLLHLRVVLLLQVLHIVEERPLQRVGRLWSVYGALVLLCPPLIPNSYHGVSNVSNDISI